MLSQGPLPDLSVADRDLMCRYIDCRGDFSAMAASLADRPLVHAPNWTILDLYAWSLSERIAAWIAFHHSRVAETFKRAALDLLLKVADAATDLVEKRRAATAILRALAPPARPRRTDPTREPPASDRETHLGSSGSTSVARSRSENQLNGGSPSSSCPVSHIPSLDWVSSRRTHTTASPPIRHARASHQVRTRANSRAPPCLALKPEPLPVLLLRISPL
jgi:hypothetical protein